MPEGPSRTYLPARTKSFMGEGAWGERGPWLPARAEERRGGRARPAPASYGGARRSLELGPRRPAPAEERGAVGGA